MSATPKHPISTDSTALIRCTAWLAPFRVRRLLGTAERASVANPEPLERPGWQNNLDGVFGIARAKNVLGHEIGDRLHSVRAPIHDLHSDPNLLVFDSPLKGQPQGGQFRRRQCFHSATMLHSPTMLGKNYFRANARGQAQTPTATEADRKTV
jgi:hypothetical protein